MTRGAAWLAKAIASCGFLSYLPAKFNPSKTYSNGAGFIGSCFGVATLPWLPIGGGSCAIVLCGALFFSIAVSDYAEESLGRLDDPRIIIDEWAGVWFSLAFLPRTWGFLLAGFILFRLFDVWKPAGIRLLSHYPGGWGVVLDDIGAGVAANAILQVALWIHGRPV